MIIHRASESVYCTCVPLSAVNGLSRLTTTSNGQTRPIRKFSNRPITVESNRIGTADSNSNRIWKHRRSLLEACQISISKGISFESYRLHTHTHSDQLLYTAIKVVHY